MKAQDNVRQTLERFAADFAGVCVWLDVLKQVKTHAVLRRTSVITALVWTMM